MARETLLRAELRGDEELQKVLAGLSDQHELVGILRPALIAAAGPMEKALAAAAPRSSGAEARRRRAAGKVPLASTMTISFAKSGGRNYRNSSAVARVRIGPAYPAGAHGHLTELGTAVRVSHGDRRVKTLAARARMAGPGLNRGAVRPQHWMLRTWEQMESSVLADLQEQISRRILKRAAYLEKKYGGAGEDKK